MIDLNTFIAIFVAVASLLVAVGALWVAVSAGAGVHALERDSHTHPPQPVPFFESLTEYSVTINRKKFDVRVWRHQSARWFVGDNEIVAVMKLKYRFVGDLADALDKLDGIAAYQIGAGNGMSGVVYREWP